MCERDNNSYCEIFNVIASKTAIEAEKEFKCQKNFYIKQQQQQKQMQSHNYPITNDNMQPQQQQQRRIHHMQMSTNYNNNNISPTSSHTSGGSTSTAGCASSPASSSEDHDGVPPPATPSAAGAAPPSIGVNLRVTGQCSQGGRKYMEDYFSVAYQQSENAKDLEYAFIGIYDGHGGAEAATFAKEHLMMEIINQKLFWSDSDQDVLRAIREGYIATHYAMWREQEKWPKTANGLPSTAGTTATVAFIRREKIYIGHVGDSGIVLGYQNENENFWRAKQLTTDHKPESLQERTRIMRSGGKVLVKSGVPRVVWNRPRNAAHKGPIRCNTLVDEIPFLAVARSLGDLWSYNSARNEFVVSPDPDVKVIKINPKTFRCLIFGTDGLWNVVSPQEAADCVYEKETINQRLQAQRGDSPAEGANGQWTNPSKGLVEKALKTWSAKKMRADNTSVVTVILYPPGGSGGDAADPPAPPHPVSCGLEYTQMNTASYNDATTYQEMAEKYLPPEEYRSFNYYQEQSAEQQHDVDPLSLNHHHTSYTIQPNATAGESFWCANAASEQMYAHWEGGGTEQPAMMHGENVAASETSANTATEAPAKEVEHGAEDEEDEEESSSDEDTDEDADDDDDDEDEEEEEEEDSISDFECDAEVKHYDWAVVLSARNQRNINLSKIAALQNAVESKAKVKQQQHVEATATVDTNHHYVAGADNANSMPPLPTYLNSFAESYNSLLSVQQEEAAEEKEVTVSKGTSSVAASNTTNHHCTTPSPATSFSNSSNSNPASSTTSYQSLSGSSMHEILQEQQRYQQQCMSEEDGYSLTKLETRRATASGGVQTFKIFQQQQEAASASYHTPISTFSGSNTAALWQQRFPAITAAYARCFPASGSAAGSGTSAAAKPLELQALLQQEREEEQQVELEQLERQRKLADALAGVAATSDCDDGEEDEPLIEEYLEEEELTEIDKVAVQINEISSSCADESTAQAAQTPEPIEVTDVSLLANADSDIVLPSNDRREQIENATIPEALLEAPTPPDAVRKVVPYVATPLYKSRRSLTKHKQTSYPNIPNENQHLSLTAAATHALCTKRASVGVNAAGCSSSLSANRGVSTLDKRQLRSTAACCVDYSKRTLRTRNSLAKDMKAKTTLASTLKRTAATTPQFLRSNLMSGGGASGPTCSRSGAVALSASNSNQSGAGNRKPTKPERLAAAAAAFSAAAAHTHAINLRSRQVSVVAASNNSASAYRRERRNLRSLAASKDPLSSSSSCSSTTATTNFSKCTRLQSSASSTLAAPPPSPKLITAADAVAAATRARSLLAKTVAVMSASSANGGGGGAGSSSAAAAAGVYSKRLSLRSGGSVIATASSASAAALRSRGSSRRLKR